jgi:hypothetical protein
MHRAKRSPLTSMALAAALTATLATRGVQADDAKAEAARSFQAGSDAYLRKDFRGAGRAFDDAYRIVPRGAAAYNAGLAWESAGERSRAADDYTRALESTDVGAAERADATGRLRALGRTLGRLSLTSPNGTRLVLDDVDLPGSSASVHVEPGTHALRVEYPGGRGESRTVLVRAGGEQSVKLGEPPEGDRPPAPAVVAPSEPADRAHESAPPPSPPDRTPVWIALGGTVVASGVAIYLFEQGLTVRNEFVSGGSTDRSLRNQAETFRTMTWVAWSVAGGLAVTAAIFYFASSSTPATSRATAPSVAVGGQGVTLRLPF